MSEFFNNLLLIAPSVAAIFLGGALCAGGWPACGIAFLVIGWLLGYVPVAYNATYAMAKVATEAMDRAEKLTLATGQPTSVKVETQGKPPF